MSIARCSSRGHLVEVANFLMLNPHLRFLSFSNFECLSDEVMGCFVAALRSIPVISSLEFYNCFGDIHRYKLQEQLFVSLKRRKKPIRKLAIKGLKFNDVNLFEACAFANKGYICDELALIDSFVVKSSSKKDPEPQESMLSSFFGKKKQQDPKFKQHIQELNFYRAMVQPPLQRLVLSGLDRYAMSAKINE